MNESGAPLAEKKLIFLKLGGSLITDKNTPRIARPDVIEGISREIRTALDLNPQLQLILGHGSGSFGHTSGKEHNTRAGVSTQAEWLGFAEVWHDAATLNHLVMASLKNADLPAVAFPPSSAVFATDRKIETWDLSPIQAGLGNQLLPVVFGDVVFDTVRGGTIISTEELFSHLAHEFKPEKILLAGKDPGVWQDFPDCTRIFETLTPENLPGLEKIITKSQAPDVTGGMADKVHQILSLITEYPRLDALIFSGDEPGNITKALSGENIGTYLHN